MGINGDFLAKNKGINGDSSPYLDAHIMGDIYQTRTLTALPQVAVSMTHQQIRCIITAKPSKDED
jgi:hypothetical protein